jgi:PIN domain nuclease of toxin-antitoxin system
MPFVLLDTHIWIWLVNGDERLEHSQALRALEKAAESSLLKVSVMSIWEVTMLEAKGRIVLDLPVREWVKHALALPGMSLAPFTEEIAIESTRLPGLFHGDPADRILVATAGQLGATFISCDQQILDYARQHQLKTISC